MELTTSATAQVMQQAAIKTASLQKSGYRAGNILLACTKERSTSPLTAQPDLSVRITKVFNGDTGGGFSQSCTMLVNGLQTFYHTGQEGGIRSNETETNFVLKIFDATQALGLRTLYGAKAYDASAAEAVRIAVKDGTFDKFSLRLSTPLPLIHESIEDLTHDWWLPETPTFGHAIQHALAHRFNIDEDDRDDSYWKLLVDLNIVGEFTIAQHETFLQWLMWQEYIRERANFQIIAQEQKQLHKFCPRIIATFDILSATRKHHKAFLYPAILMQEAPGQTITDIRPPTAQIKLIYSELTKVLQAAHSDGFEHDDIRPENFLWDASNARLTAIDMASFRPLSILAPQFEAQLFSCTCHRSLPSELPLVCFAHDILCSGQGLAIFPQQIDLWAEYTMQSIVKRLSTSRLTGLEELTLGRFVESALAPRDVYLRTIVIELSLRLRWSYYPAIEFSPEQEFAFIRGVVAIVDESAHYRIDVFWARRALDRIIAVVSGLSQYDLEMSPSVSRWFEFFQILEKKWPPANEKDKMLAPAQLAFNETHTLEFKPQGADVRLDIQGASVSVVLDALYKAVNCTQSIQHSPSTHRTLLDWLPQREEHPDHQDIRQDIVPWSKEPNNNNGLAV